MLASGPHVSFRYVWAFAFSGGFDGGAFMADKSVDASKATAQPRSRESLDVWAVLLAFVLALLVRVGVLQHVAW
jgi:hypothetical protein